MINIKNKKSKLNILVFIVYILLLFIISKTSVYFFVFLTIHEASHCIVCKKFGYKVKGIIFLPFGFNARLKDNFIKPEDDILISLAGPLINLVMYLFFYIINIYFHNVFKMQEDINLILFIFNILPAGFLDGGRILSAFLIRDVNFYSGYYIISLNGIIFGCIILIMAFVKFNLINSIVMILMGTYFIYFNIIKIKNLRFLIINSIIYKEWYLNKRTKYKVRHRGYSLNTKIFNIIMDFSMSSYNIIYVFDKNEKIKTIEEKEIIKSFLMYGNIKLCRIIYNQEEKI